MNVACAPAATRGLGVLDGMHGRNDRRGLRDLHALTPFPSIRWRGAPERRCEC